jgi:ComF family protein
MSLWIPILPPRCPVTQEIVDYQGTLSPAAWVSLNFIAAPYCKSCGVPLELDLGKETQCLPCMDSPPVYDRARAALVYDEQSKGLILGFKHGDQTHTVVNFVPWLRQAGVQMLDECDILIPVPLHRWRLLQRRYNQAALMAMALGRATRKAVWADGLVRTRSTPIQGHLNRTERARNVAQAFAVNPKREVQGKNILLIDDVYTTGATVSECAKALKKAGAARVDVLTLARVVRPRDIT